MNNFSSNILELEKTFDNVESILTVLSKKIESVEDTNKSLAVKNNVGVYNDVAGAFNAINEMVAEVKKTVAETKEAAIATHKRGERITSGLDI